MGFFCSTVCQRRGEEAADDQVCTRNPQGDLIYAGGGAGGGNKLISIAGTLIHLIAKYTNCIDRPGFMKLSIISADNISAGSPSSHH